MQGYVTRNVQYGLQKQKVIKKRKESRKKRLSADEKKKSWGELNN